MPKILIIDDDKDLLTVSRSLLMIRGFEVEINLNWEKGFDSIDLFQPQIILLDVFLAGIDGLDICGQLKARPETRDIPVIIFSGFPRSAETMIYDYGADGFIAKPFEINELIDKVHAVLSKKSEMA